MLILLTVLVGCSTPPPVPVDITYSAGSLSKASAVNLAVQGLEECGYAVETVDGVSGVVTTKWKTGILLDSRLIVTVQEDPAVIRIIKFSGGKDSNIGDVLGANDKVVIAIRDKVGGEVRVETK